MPHDHMVARQLPSGAPLQPVRVTFLNRAMVEHRARPLFDNTLGGFS